MFETDWVDKFQDVIDSTKPRYKCIKAYKTINVGDIAFVKIKISQNHNSICVTANRHSYFMNTYTLEEYFIKL